MAIALALLLPFASQAQPATVSVNDQAVCDTIARTVLAVEPPDGWRGPWQSPVRALGKTSANSFSVDTEGWRAERTQALDKLRQEFRADRGLLESIGRLTDDRWVFSLHRFGRSPLHMAKVIEGSASCQRFVFFTTSANDAAHQVVEPDVVKAAEPSAFCYRTSAYAAEVADVPAFVVESDYDSNVELSFTPWRSGSWQSECRVLIRFSDVFEVTDRFCKDVDCQALADDAVALVRKVDQDPQAADEKIVSAKFKAMNERAEKDPSAIASFPTFGGTVHGSSQAEFAPDSVLLPFIVGDETYLARVGHFAVGWRTYPDYLLAAYRMVGDRLEPAAGLYISKTRGKPISATVN
jgi:hypothetical protein